MRHTLKTNILYLLTVLLLLPISIQASEGLKKRGNQKSADKNARIEVRLKTELRYYHENNRAKSRKRLFGFFGQTYEYRTLSWSQNENILISRIKASIEIEQDAEAEAAPKRLDENKYIEIFSIKGLYRPLSEYLDTKNKNKPIFMIENSAKNKKYIVYVRIPVNHDNPYNVKIDLYGKKK